MPGTIRVLLETPQWLVVDKPAGMLSVPARWAEDPRRVLKSELERGYGRVWQVHRLDAQVSGLVLYARDAPSHRAASMAFEARTVRKTYRAWTTGGAEVGAQFVWKDALKRGKKRTYAHPGGKPCETEARVIAVLGGGLLDWRLQPLTGRTHQLRVHLANAGFPIVGDDLYGGIQAPGMALRAVALEFSAPLPGLEARISLEAPGADR